MRNNERGREHIHPTLITTEAMLTELLSNLAFKTRPVISADNGLRIMRDGKYTGQPQRSLIAQENEGFESHAIVSIEDGRLCIYYYEFQNDLFRIWEKLSGDSLDPEEIKKTIRAATKEKEIAIRFYSFWPERIQSSGALDIVLANIGFKSKDIPWPKGLPSAGESASAYHRLILGWENHLDTDALVSVENAIVYIYYRNPLTESFQEWAKLTGKNGDYSTFRSGETTVHLTKVYYSTLYSAITSAMTNVKTKKRFED